MENFASFWTKLIQVTRTLDHEKIKTSRESERELQTQFYNGLAQTLAYIYSP